MKVIDIKTWITIELGLILFETMFSPIDDEMNNHSLEINCGSVFV